MIFVHIYASTWAQILFSLTHMHMCVHIQTHTHIHKCMQAYTHMNYWCMLTFTHTHTRTHTNKLTNIGAHTLCELKHTCTHKHMHTLHISWKKLLSFNFLATLNRIWWSLQYWRLHLTDKWIPDPYCLIYKLVHFYFQSVFCVHVLDSAQ